jgi:hypothetical protein
VLKCLKQQSWDIHSTVLHGAGTLANAKTCYIIADGIHQYPGIHGDTEFSIQAPSLYTPVLPSVTSDEELERLRNITQEAGAEIELLTSSIPSHQMEADLRTLIRLKSTPLQQQPAVDWPTPTLIPTGLTF